ncbi:MAG: M3 family metallopeptidase [Bdellovibrionota bacterium]
MIWDYHTAKQPLDSTNLWNERMRIMTKISPMKGVYPQASFDHIMGSYDAGYYGYMWSRVYAEDMFRVVISGVLNYVPNVPPKTNFGTNVPDRQV